MNSPLILLVFWFVINLLIKSAKDKKKIEEARRKRAQQIDNRPEQNTNKQPVQRDMRKSFSNLREELASEIQRETQRKSTAAQKNVTDIRYSSNNNRTSERNTRRDEDLIVKKLEEERKVVVDNRVSETNKALDIKRDILRGVIFSEILAEPKSKQNSKRSM